MNETTGLKILVAPGAVSILIRRVMRQTPGLALHSLILLMATFLCQLPSYAGLGKAVTEKPNTIKAWCVKPLNDCIIKFENERMKVDDSDGITASQIKLVNTRSSFKLFWWPPASRDPNGMLWEVQVTYVENGKDTIASFLFVDQSGADDLDAALQRFAPSLRTIGPSIRIEKD